MRLNHNSEIVNTIDVKHTIYIPFYRDIILRRGYGHTFDQKYTHIQYSTDIIKCNIWHIPLCKFYQKMELAHII